MGRQVSEVLEKLETLKTREEKVQWLRQNAGNRALLSMLGMNFNKELKWMLPEGEPPFKTDKTLPDGFGDTNLLMELRRLYIWTDPKRANLPKTKREQLFIELLEGLHWKEAQVLCAVKDKALHKKYKALTKSLVSEAFPGLITQDEPETEKEPKQ